MKKDPMVALASTGSSKKVESTVRTHHRTSQAARSSAYWPSPGGQNSSQKILRNGTRKECNSVPARGREGDFATEASAFSVYESSDFLEAHL